MTYEFKNQEEKDRHIARLEALKDKLTGRQRKIDQLAMEMAKKEHPHTDWLDLKANQRDYYWSEAGSRVFWEERQARLNRP